MDGACLRYTELPGTSRLFADYLYDFGKLARFYRHAPREASSFAASQAEIDYPDSRRAALTAALSKLNSPDSPNLKRLAQPGTVCVVTGQQVGLFTGPAYTVFKAVTAATAARELTANGIPAVPVFWLATEDHDFPEIAAAHVFDAAANVCTLRVSTSGAPDRPVGPIAPDGGFPLDALQQALSGLPFADEVMALLRDAHAGAPSMGKAFFESVRRILAPLDLIFLDPLEPAIRAIGEPFLRNAVTEAEGLYPKLLDRNRDLIAADYHAQVNVEADTSLFFLLEGDRRIALKRKDGAYIARDRRFTPAELAERAGSISPNALLRPVLQDFLLPSVAYVGGPAELAYFAQSEVLYSGLLGRMPVMLPRNGYTLMSARSQKLLTRYELALPDALVRHEKLDELISAKLVPDSLHALFRESGEQTSQILDRLTASLQAFDPSLAKAIGKSRSKISYQLSKMEAKTAREALRRDQRATDEAAYLSHQLFPEHHLQERFFSILPFLAQYGLDLVNRIVDHSCLDCVDHHILHV
jgi:bacillithiol biosynthesis cysteine-adding enzyme BshC